MRFTDGELSPDRRSVALVRGEGLSYSYCPDSRVLQVLHTEGKKNLLHIPCKKFLHEKLDGYVEALEKSTQLHALMLSAHTTNRLVDVIHQDKLPALLHHTARIAHDALCLEHAHYDCFSKAIRHDYELGYAKLRYVRSSHTTHDEYEGHYKIRIKTHKEDSATARSCALHHALHNMASLVMMDMVSNAYTSDRRSEAETLMKLSSRLDTLGHVLNYDYIPAQNIRSENMLPSSTKRHSA